MARHVMTARRRAALRKAQMASARKRKGKKGRKKSLLLQNHTKTALVLGGAALADRAINRGAAKAFGVKPAKASFVNNLVLAGSAGYLAGHAYGSALRKIGNRKKARKARKGK